LEWFKIEPNHGCNAMVMPFCAKAKLMKMPMIIDRGALTESEWRTNFETF